MNGFVTLDIPECVVQEGIRRFVYRSEFFSPYLFLLILNYCSSNNIGFSFQDSWHIRAKFQNMSYGIRLS